MQQKHKNATLNDTAILCLLADDEQTECSRGKLKMKKNHSRMGSCKMRGGVVQTSVNVCDTWWYRWLFLNIRRKSCLWQLFDMDKCVIVLVLIKKIIKLGRMSSKDKQQKPKKGFGSWILVWLPFSLIEGNLLIVLSSCIGLFRFPWFCFCLLLSDMSMCN